jgi:hypothetical protein
MEYVTDERLEALSMAFGPNSTEARALELLRYYRARDRQVFAFRIGQRLMIGPMPDGRTKLMALMALTCARRA